MLNFQLEVWLFDVMHVLKDKPWAEFSTLEVAACHAIHLPHSIAVRPYLELKTRPLQLLGSLPLDIMLPYELHSATYPHPTPPPLLSFFLLYNIGLPYIHIYNL